MSLFDFLIIVLILAIVIIMISYAVKILKLMRLLETSHPEELKVLNFGKKMSGWGYYTTPRQAKNVLKFIFSKNHLQNRKVQILQSKLKFIIYSALIWLVLFILVTISYSQ